MVDILTSHFIAHRTFFLSLLGLIVVHVQSLEQGQEGNASAWFMAQENDITFAVNSTLVIGTDLSQTLRNLQEELVAEREKNKMLMQSIASLVPWHPVNSGTSSYLRDVSAVNNDVAFAVGDDSIVATTDGYHWARLNVTAQFLYTVSAVDAKLVFAVTSLGIVLKTKDGGRSWAESKIIPDDVMMVNDVSAVSADVAFVVGRSWRGVGAIYKTTNGGEDWTYSGGSSNNLTAVSAVSADIAFVVGWSGDVLVTTDGGATWVPQPNPYKVNLYSVAAVSSSVAWVGGANGLIMKTCDAGQTWQKQVSGTGGNIISISAIDAWVAFAINSYRAFVTTDAGVTWRPEACPHSDGLLTAVAAVNASVAFIVGTKGELLARTRFNL